MLIVIVNVIILAVLAGYFISGMRRGLIRQLMDIVGIIVAFVGAFYFAHYLARYLEVQFDVHYQISLVLAAVALFVGIILLFRFIGIVMRKLADITLLSGVDRLGGGILGALKGALLISLILVVIFGLPFSDDFKNELRSSRLVTAIQPMLPWVFNLALKSIPGQIDFEKNILRESKGKGPGI